MRRLEEEIANAGSPPHDEQVPPLEEDDNMEQSPANPPPMKETKMRYILDQMSQLMTNYEQAMTVQYQPITDHA